MFWVTIYISSMVPSVSRASLYKMTRISCILFFLHFPKKKKNCISDLYKKRKKTFRTPNKELRKYWTRNFATLFIYLSIIIVAYKWLNATKCRIQKKKKKNVHIALKISTGSPKELKWGLIVENDRFEDYNLFVWSAGLLKNSRVS